MAQRLQGASGVLSMRIRTIFFFLTAIFLATVLAQPPEAWKQRFVEAERRIQRLPPTAFVDELPKQVVEELQRRGCTIPQGPLPKMPHNAIKGQFAKSSQTDWAVLCSINGVSSILVFWNGSANNPASIAQREDRTFLQTISADEIGFSRGISPVDKEFIMRHYRAYGGPKPPPIDHQGIDDAFIGKASVTWYFFGGKWLGLQGAD